MNCSAEELCALLGYANNEWNRLSAISMYRKWENECCARHLKTIGDAAIVYRLFGSSTIAVMAIVGLISEETKVTIPHDMDRFNSKSVQHKIREAQTWIKWKRAAQQEREKSVWAHGNTYAAH